MPVNAEAMSADAEVMPVDAEAMPLDAEAMIVDAEAMPLDAEAMPVSAEVMSADAEVMPVDAEAMPVDTGVETTAIETQVKPKHVKNYHETNRTNCKSAKKSNEVDTEPTFDREISVDDLMRKAIKLQSSFELNFNCHRFEIIIG